MPSVCRSVLPCAWVWHGPTIQFAVLQVRLLHDAGLRLLLSVASQLRTVSIPDVLLYVLLQVTHWVEG